MTIKYVDRPILIKAGGYSFRSRAANLDSNSDAVILLHGFPQTSISWRPVIKVLAEKGFRVVAFDQRGYSSGARPKGIDSYKIENLVNDVFEIADAVGFDRFHVAGHDWGSAVAWSALMTNPDRIISLSALSIAHPRAFFEAVKMDKDQQKRSRYFLLFRSPWLPELLLKFNRMKVLRSLFYKYMPTVHTDEYLQVFSKSGALTSALNWYRAMGKGIESSLDPVIEKPVLFIWGNRDPAAGRKAVELQKKYIKGSYKKVELDAGHWLLERKTDVVIESILSHIKKNNTRQ